LHKVPATDKQEEMRLSDKPAPAKDEEKKPEPAKQAPREIGGPKGPEPTRYNDWEKGGRCVDF